jgi:4-diphosphocytidyl-2-C-methyl-D-erythritol kinase
MLTLSAPAKLNLFLHVLGRRPDGYHELQTVFQLLEYGDELQFSPTGDDKVSFSCNLKELETADNLVTRAAALLQAFNTQGRGCHIHLLKRLPLGGGLGGGSSDAATTLVALNALWHCGLDQPGLMTLGKRLGADVPLFIFGHSAWAEGVGEKLQITTLPELWYVVITPSSRAATAEIFSHPQLTRNSAAIRIPPFPFSGTRNDCQTVACLLHPEIEQAIGWLGQFSKARIEAKMTGTGSSVFAGFGEQAQALAVLAQLPAKFSGFVARGVNRSPLFQGLEQKLIQQLPNSCEDH